METVEQRTPVTFDGRTGPLDLTAGAHNRVVVVRPRAYRATPAPIAALPGCALLVPAAVHDDQHPIAAVLAAVHHAHALGPRSVVLVIGTVASDEDPALGDHRAQSLRCLIEHDHPAWERLAIEAGSLLEVKSYLDYLARRRGWGCSVSSVDAVEDAESERSIIAFQEEFNQRFARSIWVDGVCGTETLGAILDVLHHEWTSWLRKHGLGAPDLDDVEFVYGNAAPIDPPPPALDPVAGKPGVDLLVVPRNDLQGAAATAELVLTSKTARWGQFDVPLEPGAWEHGTYTVVTDLEPGEHPERETYRLSTTDGSWASELNVDHHGEVDGLVELRFTDVPCEQRFELSVRLDEEEPQVLFTDVAYGDLHKLASGQLEMGMHRDG